MKPLKRDTGLYRTQGIVGLCVMLGISAVPTLSWTQAFIPLGIPSGHTVSKAYGVSADGQIVVGYYNKNKRRAFRWECGEWRDLGTLGGSESVARSVSMDGSVVVGEARAVGGITRAFRWTAAGGMQDLGTLGGPWSVATGVSADGSIVVGTASTQDIWFGDYQTRAFRWTAVGGMQNLGTLPRGDWSGANGVSADGSVVVGWSYTSGATGKRAFRWTADGGMQDLGTLNGYGDSEAYGVSADGSVIVGWSSAIDGTRVVTRAFRWTAAGGMQNLGTLPRAWWSVAYAVSADGSVVVGTAGPFFDGDTHAFRWTAERGMEDLNQVYASVIPAGWVLEAATAISPDGRYIVGYGRNPAGRTEAWLLDTVGNGPCVCTVQIENCPNGLWHGETFTFRASADQEGGTFQWQVIQQNNQLSPTSGTGSTFQVRAVNPSRNRNDRVTVRVTYRRGRATCVSECQLVVYPRPERAYLIYRNESAPMNAYPFENENLALWVVIQASDGEYYTGTPYDPNNRGVWFSNDGRWLITGTDGRSEGGESAHFDSRGQAWVIDRPVREWWGPELRINWYELSHQVDREVQLTRRQCGRRALYYIYPPYGNPSLRDPNGNPVRNLGWGVRNVRLSAGTHRFQVRVSWQDQQGRRQVVASPGPTPGDWRRPNEDDQNINWNLTWSQNCDEQNELAVRISVRRVANWVQTERKRRYLEWLTSFLEVPYEWGGHWYGGRADGTDDTIREDPGYHGYGTDCSGLVSAGARWAGYNWGRGQYPWRTNCTGLMDPWYTRPQTIENMEPGDILNDPGSHVVTIYQIVRRWQDNRGRWRATIIIIDACAGSKKVDIHFPRRNEEADDIHERYLRRGYHLRELVAHQED